MGRISEIRFRKKGRSDVYSMPAGVSNLLPLACLPIWLVENHGADNRNLKHSNFRDGMTKNGKNIRDSL